MGKVRRLVMGGALTNLLPELFQEGNMLSPLFRKVLDRELLEGVCKACSAKMVMLQAAEEHSLKLLADMGGHSSLACHIEMGYDAITCRIIPSATRKACHGGRGMDTTKELLQRVVQRWRGLRRSASEVLYGMTLHELELELRRERRAFEDLLLLAIFGDMLGLPFFPPYFALRLLPYVIPSLEVWKRSLIREKDLTELVGRE